MEPTNGSRKHSLDLTQPQLPVQSATASLACGSSKRKLYAIDECDEGSPLTAGELGAEAAEAAYDADVDELEHSASLPLSKLTSEREVIYELFQPWALKTYGDQAKTKTITLRKKARILKALEGKEHSRPDSSKFRFWVKTKGFTTKRPDGFEETPGSRRRHKQLPPTAVLSDTPGAVDLFAASTSKDFGRRIYRKVACVEEFFDIIYNVHMELGGRSGMHAGQKRTYRIITETYAFLPREAVTRFLTICPECKKNLRPSSPSTGSKDNELAGNESSSEVETYLNYSSHTESSLEAGPTAKRRRHSSAEIKAQAPPLATSSSIASSASATQLDVIAAPTSPTGTQLPIPQAKADETQVVSAPAPSIRVKSHLLRPLSPAAPAASATVATAAAGAAELHSFDLQLIKSRDNLLRYYDFMRRFYAGGSGSALNQPVLAPPLYGSSLLQSLSYPATTTTHTQSQSLAQTQAQSAVSKTSPQCSARARTPLVSSATPTSSQAPSTPVNLTKSLFSSNGQPASTSTPVALLPPPLKLELPSPPKPLPELRIPQLRGSSAAAAAAAEQLPLPLPLPPLDLERLKPITSTYLQLTRSMGLSDEDALRFDNLVSKDFKYTL
ncbi:CG16879 [Drosophila busckii]|uniref:CG16879 n=1 Tax=Drosophila busckii TaxID=30019 RepID=A0A0M4ERR2_DROBS|nr:CG16879 [Drosophila busckii]